MPREREKITTLGALLSALWNRDWNTRKTRAEINLSEGLCQVTEYFDSGAGHSSAFSSETSEVELSVFEEAKKKEYVVGKPMRGYTSTTTFILTEREHLHGTIYAILEKWREKDDYAKRSQHDVSQGKPGTYIKIVKVPDGEAPEEIRKAWVGLILPCHPDVGHNDDREKGALSCKENARNRYGYAVRQRDAIELLGYKNPAAAQWWKDHGFPQGDDYFSFYHMEVEEIAGTFRHTKITVREAVPGALPL